jgi:FkbM family methyltransferase
MPGSSQHRPGDPIPLRPRPGSLGSCPRCRIPLDVAGLHIAGWRSLVRGTCRDCRGRFLQDLPAGHGLMYPASLDLDTGETIAAPGSEWFSGPLRRYWERPDAEPLEVRVLRRRDVSKITVLNCLDVVYGHALLKLLNVSRELDARHELAVLVPSTLAHVVPETVAEVWTVGAPLGRLRAWLLDLETRVDTELDRFESAALSPAFPHPHPATYRLADFTGGLPPQREGNPSIILSLRDDRRWGTTGSAQLRRVKILCRRLRRRFPDAGFAAVGVGGATRLPSVVVDRRSAAPTGGDERAWLARAAGADLVIGVHGSNLLLPSGLARMTIELVPGGRYGNALQATLLAGDDPLESLWRHRLIYGDARLSDVSAERVADIAAVMLAEDERFDAVMLGPLSGRGGELPAPVGASDQLTPPALVRLFEKASVARSRARGAAAVAQFRAKHAIGNLRARRGPEPPRVMTDRRGLRFELVSRGEIAQFLVHDGHFESREVEFLTAFAEPGAVVLDVGANIGAFSAALARAVAPGGTVHAFEPVATSRRRLERTLELNGLRNVIVNALAVGATPAEVEIVSYGPGFESWASTVPRRIEVGTRVVEPVGRTTVEATTLDAYCEERGIAKAGIAKIDVEGGEPAVIEGAEGLLSAGAIDLLLFELSDNTLPDTVRPHEVIDRVTRHGYRTFVLSDEGPVPFRSAGRLEFANVIAVAPEALERLPRRVSRG